MVFISISAPLSGVLSFPGVVTGASGLWGTGVYGFPSRYFPTSGLLVFPEALSGDINSTRYATRYGGIDDDVADPDGLATQDGGPWSAHTLALMERQVNYQVTRGDCAWSALFDARADDDEDPGGFKGYGAPFWTPISPPFPVPKKPGRASLDFYLGGLATSGHVVWFQVTTSRAPFRPDAVYPTAANVTRLAGNGTTPVDVGITDLPCNPDANFEVIQIFVLGLPTGTAGNEAANGATNTGTVDVCPTDTSLYDLSATWSPTTPASTDWSVNHTVRIENTAGQTIVSPRLITVVPSATALEFWPPLTINRTSLLGSTYFIEEVPTWRLQYLELYTVGD